MAIEWSWKWQKLERKLLAVDGTDILAIFWPFPTLVAKLSMLKAAYIVMNDAAILRPYLLWVLNTD